MDFWTFLDRNLYLFLIAGALMLVVTRTSCSRSSNGCSVEIGDKPAAVDGGAS